MVNGVNDFGVNQEEDFLSLAARPFSLDVGAPIDPLSGTGQERGSKVRDFVTSFARPGTLFNALSRGFGVGTEEIAQRKRQRLADRITEAEGEARLKVLAAPVRPKRNVMKGIGGALVDVDTGERVSQIPLGQDQTALQLKIDELMTTGLDRNTASNVATGRFRVSRDPVTKVAQIIDVATGQIVGEKPTVGGDIVNVDLEPTTTSGLGFSGQPTSDPTEATGAGGALKSAANVMADLFGANLPFEEADKATNEIKNLNLKTVQIMSSGIAGKPNVAFQDQIRELLPKPNEIFTGSGQVRNRFEAISKTLREQAVRLQGDLKKGNVTPETRDDFQKRISGLLSLSAEYDNLLQRSSPQGKGDITRFFK